MTLAAGLRLDLKQSQSLVLTPQLQQAIRLLQMSSTELSSAVDREVSENPFLERVDGGAPARSRADGHEPGIPDAVASPVARPDGYDDGWIQPGATRPADCSLRVQRSVSRTFDGPSTDYGAHLTKPITLREHVLRQVGGQVRDRDVRRVAATLVELMDEAGYLREPDELLASQLRVDLDLVVRARAAIQACDPAGLGARELAECLRLQLAERNRLDPAMRALVENLPLLARADFDGLMLRCAIDAEDLQEMIGELRRLDPRPGTAFEPDEAVTLIPDVFVYPGAGGSWRVELNGESLPRVLVQRDYHDEISDLALDRPNRDYMNERLQSATFLAKALHQRARTMLRVARAVFGRQRAFLDRGAAGLRPLVLRDIAEATGLHESTVSRATANKYAATPHGTYPFKYFFTTALPAAGGGEAHSAEAIRQLIRRLVDREDPKNVLADDAIVVELKARGIAVARRTVAKYRESLGIPSSVDRRRTKALGR